ncbi:MULTISPECIES: DUF2388 domain-containing protein [Pseudomonas]|uniref:DUF2388 domain-containing protein n=1 Tax=Pseudomonas mandelii TaxID=75612 RepID=A0AB36D2S2_9PSED|nr:MULTISPECIES: DUF2388 domain-containing protein [Pseudomonas]NMZ82261.1 DUF2388 domain-containing protein [Pseudomonas mandelii]TWC14377.1 uncharacterized protein (TIGR02448 family) [Pseudomonas sp. SJZ083]TWC43486.1 uncharacterized protein (TIGR02448 family) [Pseudomonas sp. SJZ077]
MKTARLVLLSTCLLGSGAHATSFVISTDVTVSLTMSSTKGTSGSFSDDKIVLAAKDDAAAFVASEGVIRGARIQAAFLRIRGVINEPYSDQQLATAILML